MAGIQGVHPIEHTQERGLAAAGRPDERRNAPVGEFEVDVDQRTRLSVIEVELAGFKLRRQHLRRVVPRLGRGELGCAHLCAFPPGSAEMMRRAMTLKSRIASVMRSAPDQASCCQSLYGLKANWKITTGRFAMG